MRNFLFKCSRLGILVQGSIPEADLPEADARIAYECPACRSIHIVDPRASGDPSPVSKPDSD